MASRKHLDLNRIAPAIFGCALFALFVFPVFDPDVQLYYRDTGRMLYPVKRFIADELRRGTIPLWWPWTEAGTSLLAQVTPGLFHPFTLLYLVFPFDFAFKLNHVLPLLLGGIGVYLLARRLGASPWAATAGGIAYGGSGFLVSMAAGILPYALGPATVPFALEGFLAFLARPRIGALARASFALALCTYAGDPQSMLIGGLIGTAWGVAQGLLSAAPAPPALRFRRASRAGALAALWGACSLALAAPAAFPAIARLPHSDRAHGVSELDKNRFGNGPFRLPGLLVPRAFDYNVEVDPSFVNAPPDTFFEYFAGSTATPLTDSICLGVPAFLLACIGAAGTRRGRFLLLGALIFILASTADAFGIQDLLFVLVPGFRLFRHAEKFIAPATLLLAVAAALGVEEVLRNRRLGVALSVAGGSLALASLGLVWFLRTREPWVLNVLIGLGRLHHPVPARQLVVTLRDGLLGVAALAGVLAIASAGLDSRRLRSWRAATFAACCAVAVFTHAIGLLFVAPLDLLRGEKTLAQELIRRAGPSPGRWRVFADMKAVPQAISLDGRVALMFSALQSLVPQADGLAGIEGAAEYASAPDPYYMRAWKYASSRALAPLFTVRFVVVPAAEFTESEAKASHFERVADMWRIREFPPAPRAFVVNGARVVTSAGHALSELADPRFDPHLDVLLPSAAAGIAARLQPHGSPEAGSARIERPTPNRLVVKAESRGPGVLVVSEHFDPGWTATVDGNRAPVVRADLLAMGVPLGPGQHRIELRFWPVGLSLGLLTFAVTTALFLLAWFCERAFYLPKMDGRDELGELRVQTQ